jgi:6-phosphogluconate dehydrogenase
MQLIAEIYDILKELAQLDRLEISNTFKGWNEGELGLGLGLEVGLVSLT